MSADSADPTPKAAIIATRVGSFGDLAVACFLIAALSGVLLAVPYSPADAYGSLATLLLANPAGALFRNLHYWAGQLCFVAVLLHVADHLRAGTEDRVRPAVWLRLVLAIAVLAFVQLSGFLLRGDADAQQALRILTEVTSQIPLIGAGMATLAFGAQGAVDVVYVQHVATATLAVWFFSIEHSRRLWPQPVSFVAALLALLALSLFFSPGLHDGLDPVIKGPWYFLGLQEILHWTAWPVLVVAGIVVVLAALVAVRFTKPTRARALKMALLALVVSYGGLSAIGAFARGENWAWQAYWPSGGGNLRPGWLFAAADAPEPLPLPLPTAMGRPDGCLVCHRGVTGLGNAHRPEAVGCASCHGGDVLTLDKSRAHAGMEAIPGEMATAALRCGQSACHQPIVHRVGNSLMNTMAGVIAADRALFGEPTGLSSVGVPRAGALGHSAADTHLRQLCAICHLGTTKEGFGPNTENARGGGCNACHLTYDRDSRQALAAYEAQKRGGKAEAPTRHPSIGLDIGNGQCFGCHSRSGRISTNYEGWHEVHEPSAAVRATAHFAADLPGRYRLLEDGRVFERAAPDIHAQLGMDCIDCHTANEVMGDGAAPARKHEALRVACEDCHARPGSRLSKVANTEIDPESRRLMALRGWLASAGEQQARAHSGETLVNVVIDRAGTAQMLRKRTGERRPLKPAMAACAEGGGHERFACGSCHTAWAPRCPTCHVSFDPKATAYDAIADADVTGAWKEQGGPFVGNAPTLGVRTGAKTPGGRGVIETFTPGMIMTLDRSTKPGTQDVVATRLYARVEPHTTRREARTCESCHNDPEALGYGRGTLRLQRTAPGKGHWLFTPAEPALQSDGLPTDAWIPFLGTRSGKVSTRDDVRPFGIDEQRRILTVGACLTCHAPQSRPMRESVRDWAKVLAARRPVCIVPQWP